ncbi:BsuBI/PstI family type II restriction endonuclease, partial [Providencia rettgeri]|uniref:BsuBI/PstI family type II restriction endonuclease n=1 Tax=Providencia rettgeri TaxID=587 RepID=UPI0024800CB8
REESCLEIERLCRDAHAKGVLMFAKSTAGLVYVTAFPNRAIMGRYLSEIAWETEVWVADAPSHLIHFNGVRFLGPYDE